MLEQPPSDLRDGFDAAFDYYPPQLDIDAACFLPPHLRQWTIAEMREGQSGWTHPHALLVNEDFRCFIKTWYGLVPERVGEHTLHISMLAGGYVVDASETRFRWPRRNLRSEINLERPLRPVVEVRDRSYRRAKAAG